MRKHDSTILVVEDDPNDRLLIEAAFRSIGPPGPVHLVNNGLQAIACLMGEGHNSGRAAGPESETGKGSGQAPERRGAS